MSRLKELIESLEGHKEFLEYLVSGIEHLAVEFETIEFEKNDLYLVLAKIEEALEMIEKFLNSVSVQEQPNGSLLLCPFSGETSQ